MKKKLSTLSVILGFLAYIYMVIMTIKGTGEGLSFTTFALWAALGWISGFIIMKKGFSPAVPFIYATGATTTTIVLLIKGRYGWTGFDSVIAALVAICIILMFSKNDKLAFVVSIFAGWVAIMPFVIMTWQTPSLSPIIPNTGFFLANVCLFFSAKTWKLEDWLYGASNALACSLLIIPWLMTH